MQFPIFLVSQCRDRNRLTQVGSYRAREPGTRPGDDGSTSPGQSIRNKQSYKKEVEAALDGLQAFPEAAQAFRLLPIGTPKDSDDSSLEDHYKGPSRPILLARMICITAFTRQSIIFG